MSDQSEVPETITGYLYDDYGNYTETREFDPYGGFPLNVTLTPPPETPEGKFAVYLYPNWYVWDEKAKPAPPPPPPPIEGWQVDQEKERRVAMGFVYNGKAFQTNSQSQMNDILGKMADAMAAILIDQVDPASLKWSDPDHDFYWSAADGSLVPMTAPECLEFTRAAVRRKEKLVAAALVLKAMSPIPVDYYMDSYWPAMEVTSKAARK